MCYTAEMRILERKPRLDYRSAAESGDPRAAAEVADDRAELIAGDGLFVRAGRTCVAATAP